MYLHKSDKLTLIRILSGGHPLSNSPALTLLNVFVRCRGGWARVEQNARVEGLHRKIERERERERERESPRNDRFEVNEEGRDSEGVDD